RIAQGDVELAKMDLEKAQKGDELALRLAKVKAEEAKAARRLAERQAAAPAAGGGHPPRNSPARLHPAGRRPASGLQHRHHPRTTGWRSRRPPRATASPQTRGHPPSATPSAKVSG